MAYEVPVTQARAEFAELVNRAVYGGERIVVTRHGKPLVAIVPAADLERLEELDRPAPLTVVRLSSTSLGGPASPQAGGEYRFDIAAQHQPPQPPGDPSQDR